MTDQPRPELLKGQAYRLFLEELDHNMAFTREVLGMERVSAARHYSDLKLKFHSIKGASGFFGFSRIAAVAGRIEACAAEAERSGQLDAGSLGSSLDELASLVTELPVPG